MSQIVGRDPLTWHPLAVGCVLAAHADSVVVVAEDFGETRVGQVLPGRLHRPDEAAIIDMQRGLKICEIVPPGGSDS
jgi:hypothetical protein